MNQNELNDLIDAHLENNLIEKQRADLNARLQSDAAARDQFIRALRQEVLLKDLIAAQNKSNPPERTNSSSFLWRAYGAVAAAAMVIFTVAFFVSSKTQPTPAICKIISATNARVERNGGTLSAAAGFELRDQDAVHTTNTGSAELAFPDGTTLEIAPNTKLAISAYGVAHEGKRIDLKPGKLTASVAKQPVSAPMLLTTPNAEALVVGTRFVLSAETDRSSLEVTEGKVKFSPFQSRNSVEVAAGDSAVVDATGVRIVSTQKTRPTEKQKVLLVVADPVPSYAHDAEILKTLKELNLEVTERVANDVAESDADGKALIVIPSHKCRGGNLFAKSKVPIIAWHNNWHRELGLVPADEADRDDLRMRAVSLQTKTHPIASVLKDTADTEFHLQVYAWNENVVGERILSLANQPRQTVIVASDRGDSHGRRVAFSVDIRETGGKDAPVDAGKQLFIAAIKWCLEK
jgi:ferric-dicitrate binding protein FerR (iron transport regulator)